MFILRVLWRIPKCSVCEQVALHMQMHIHTYTHTHIHTHTRTHAHMYGYTNKYSRITYKRYAKLYSVIYFSFFPSLSVSFFLSLFHKKTFLAAIYKYLYLLLCYISHYYNSTRANKQVIYAHMLMH